MVTNILNVRLDLATQTHDDLKRHYLKSHIDEDLFREFELASARSKLGILFSGDEMYKPFAEMNANFDFAAKNHFGEVDEYKLLDVASSELSLSKGATIDQNGMLVLCANAVKSTNIRTIKKCRTMSVHQRSPIFSERTVNMTSNDYRTLGRAITRLEEVNLFLSADLEL